MATIRDVAAKAGVAVSTASYALSGRKKLPAATVDRVVASAEELGYYPSAAARALSVSRGRSNIIGFLAKVTPEATEADLEAFTQFVSEAVFATGKHDYDLLILGREGDLGREFVADAVLLMDVRYNEARLSILRERGVPTVMIGCPSDAHGFSAVDLDFGQAGRLAVDALSDLGHREIIHVESQYVENGEDDELAHRVFFRAGADSRAKERNVRLSHHPVERHSTNLDEWAAGCLEKHPDVTAIVVTEAGLVTPVMDAFRNHGFTFPDDLSLLAVGSERALGSLAPEVTIIDVPGRKMVSAAVDMAVSELEGSTRPGEIRLLPPELTVKRSTAPPRTR